MVSRTLAQGLDIAWHMYDNKHLIDNPCHEEQDPAKVIEEARSLII